MIQGVSPPGRRFFGVPTAASSPIRSVVAPLRTVDGAASMRAADATRASGAGVTTVQRGVTIIERGKSNAIVIAHVHMKWRVAAEEGDAKRVVAQAMPTGRLARKPHSIRSGITLGPY